jgi:hypothetical protein
VARAKQMTGGIHWPMEGHDETADGLPVLDELEDGPYGWYL